MVNSVNHLRIPSNTRRGVKHVQYGPDCEALNRYRVMSQVVYSNICTVVISTFPTYSIYALIKLQKTRNLHKLQRQLQDKIHAPGLFYVNMQQKNTFIVPDCVKYNSDYMFFLPFI